MPTNRIAATMIAVGSCVALAGCNGFMHPSTPPAATASAAQPSELSPDMVKRVQTALKQQGVYNGTVDGVWGSETQSAVRSYQQQHSLTANGQLDTATLNAMNLTAANPNGSATATNANNAAGSPPSSTSNAATNMPSGSASSTGVSGNAGGGSAPTDTPPAGNGTTTNTTGQ